MITRCPRRDSSSISRVCIVKSNTLAYTSNLREGGRERERERGERREKRERESVCVCVDRVNTGMVGLVWTDVPRADMLSHAPEKAHKFERGGGGGGGRERADLKNALKLLACMWKNLTLLLLET
jgi:hypothetical protein